MVRPVGARRRAAGLPWAAGLGLATLLACSAAPDDAHGPDAARTAPAGVVLIVGDDHGRDDSEPYGHPDLRTPALSRLADEGLRLSSVQAVTAICQPSRATLLSGLYPVRHGVFGFYALSEEVAPLPRLLTDDGVFTGLVGKRHLQPFDAYGFAFARPEPPKVAGRAPDRVAADVRAFLDALERGSHERFFLVVALHDTHRPFDGEGVERLRAGADELTVPAWLEDLPAVREELARYHAAVERLDRSVGRVLTELERAGRLDDTLVCYTADHGPAFPYAKTTAYEAGLAVPFLVRWPRGVAAGTSTDALVSLVDVTPTVLELLGAAVPAGLDGRSFAGLLTGERERHRDHLFASQTDHLRLPSRPIRAVTDGRFRYVWNAHPERLLSIEATTTPSWEAMVAAAESDPRIAERVERFLVRPPEELYDRADDPAERVNRIDDPELAGAREELRGELLRTMRALEDPLLFEAPFATAADRERARDAFDAYEALQRARYEHYLETGRAQ